MKKKNRVAFFNILSTLILRCISLITAPVFSRLLGTSGYGVLSNFNVWASVMAIVGPLQTSGTLVNARVEYPEEDQPKYQSAVMSLSLMVFLAFTAVTLLFLRPISNGLQMEKLLILLIMVQAFGSFGLNFLNTKLTYEMKAGTNMVVSVGVTVATLGLSLALVLLLPEEINYYGRILGNAIIYGLLGVAVCGYILAKGKTFYNKTYWKFCLALAMPVVFYSLSDLLLGHSDLVMLKQMRGDAISGIYGLAYQFGGIMFAIFGALNNSWVPFFFEDMKHGRDVKQQAKNYLELYTVLSVGFLLLTNEIFHYFARQDFWEGTNVIPLFVASYYLNFLCTFPVNFEYFHKKLKVVAAATIGSSLINIVLNYLFIIWFGMIGAALATLLSHSLQFALHYFYTRYVLGKGSYPFGISLWGGYALAFFGMMTLVYLTPNGWYLRWPLGAAIGIWELLRIRKRKVLI